MSALLPEDPRDPAAALWLGLFIAAFCLVKLTDTEPEFWMAAFVTPLPVTMHHLVLLSRQRRRAAMTRS